MPTAVPLPIRFAVCLSLSLGFVAGCQKTSKTPEVKGEVPGALPQVGLLVEPAELKNLLDDENTRILDARSNAAYDAGHVPGAVRVDVGAWTTQALKDDGAGLTDKAGWQTLVRQLGINDLTQVVVYADAKGLTSTARIWWTLKYLGVDDAGILNGGWERWTKKGGDSSTETPDAESGDFEVDFQMKRLATVDSLKDDNKSGDIQIIDARSDGEVAAGIIPGAVPLEWKQLKNQDGTLKSADDLKRIFADAKLVPEKLAVTYCQSGGRASLNAFALELAGFKKVKNYYGSWQQWKRRKLPVEKPGKN